MDVLKINDDDDDDEGFYQLCILIFIINKPNKYAKNKVYLIEFDHTSRSVEFGGKF